MLQEPKTFYLNEYSDDDDLNDNVIIQLSSNIIKINFYQLTKLSKLVRDEYPKNEIDRLSNYLQSYQRIYNIKEENIVSFFKCISSEQVQITFDRFFDYHKLSKLFKVSKLERILRKYFQDYKNDTDFILKVLNDQLLYQNDDINNGNLYGEISPDMEDILCSNINQCLQNPEFGQLPVSKILRLFEKSSESIQNDILYDFIKESIDERYILLNFLNIRTLSDQKFNDLCEICSDFYTQYLKFDLEFLKEIKKEKEKLKNQLDIITKENKQNKIEKNKLSKENKQVNIEKERLSIENEQLKKDTADMVEKIQNLNKDNDKLTSEIKQLKTSKNERHHISRNFCPIISTSVSKTNPSKNVISLVVLGHSGSGKSTLIGHLLYNCKCIDENQFIKIEQEAIRLGQNELKYAFIADILKNEREKLMTTNVSHLLLETKKYYFDIIDTPGNSRFIKNTIKGISQAEASILVIDSINYEQYNNQIIDQALIAYTFGIKQLIVVVNKIDDRTVNYSKQRFDEIKNEITPILTNIGFKPDQYTFIPISGFCGDNLAERSLKIQWWTGNDLVDSIDTFEPEIKSRYNIQTKPLRFSVNDIYDIPGVGTVVTGPVLSGTLKPGQEIFFNLSKIRTKIKSIELHHNQILEAIPKNFVGINIDVPASSIKIGDICGDASIDPPRKCINFTVQMIIVNHPGRIRAGYSPDFFVHTTHFPCRFSKLVQRIDRHHGKKVFNDPDFIQKDDAAVVIIEPLKPITVESFMGYQYLGRIVIRDNSMTVAVGVIRCVEKEK